MLPDEPRRRTPRLSDEQLEVVLNWIKKKTKGGGACSECGSRDWALMSDMLAMSIFIPPSGADRQGSMVMDIACPAIALSCKNCGYLKLFRADVLGLMGEPNG